MLPVVTALTRQLVEDAERAHGEQLRSLGASTLMRSLILAWDERFALLTVVIAAFGRAVSEVGAVMVVGGNIEGFTRVMTTAIALETSKGDLPLALGLGMVLLGVVLVLWDNRGYAQIRQSFDDADAPRMGVDVSSHDPEAIAAALIETQGEA